MIRVLKTYLDKITDGTLRTTRDICEADRTRLAYLYTTTRTGFLQIRNTDLINKTIDDYKAVVLNDPHWEHFHHDKLDCYFGEQIDLTPCGTLNADMKTGSMTPEALICLSLGRIEKQFPGGLMTGGEDADFGDQDVRDLISAKGLVFYANHQHLYQARRDNVAKLYRHAAGTGAIALAALVPVAIFANPLGGYGVAITPALLLASVIAFHVRSIFTRRRHRALADQFNAAIRLSCATVSKCAILRQDSLINACHVMFEITNNGKEDYWVEGRLRRWTEVNEKWCELIFWLNGRINANANYAFIRSKLIGMTLEGLVAQAQFRALLLTAGWLSVLGLLTAASLIAVCLGQWPAAAFIPYAAYMWWQMLRLHVLIRADDTPDAVAEILNTDSLNTMKGHKEAKLHEEVAHFMKREKLKQLYAERTRLNSGVAQDVGLP